MTQCNYNVCLFTSARFFHTGTKTILYSVHFFEKYKDVCSSELLFHFTLDKNFVEMELSKVSTLSI